MTRTDIINYLILKNNYKTYLEVGVSNKSYNFNYIIAEDKIGVDPAPTADATYVLESDEFFKQNKKYFDIIFIDGLHVKDQFERDVINSLNVLNDNGTIVCHDCLPNTYEEQVVPPIPGYGAWTGDVWRGVAFFRMNKEDISIDVVDTDYGCGIIKKGRQDLYIKKDNDDIDWNYFQKNRNQLMNVITIGQFRGKY